MLTQGQASCYQLVLELHFTRCDNQIIKNNISTRSVRAINRHSDALYGHFHKLIKHPFPAPTLLFE